jgi:release factor glutamine methyltransferase
MKAREAIKEGEAVLLASDAIDHWQKGREMIEADDLLAHAFAREYSKKEEVPKKVLARYRRYIERRSTGEPTQLIKGYSVFRGLELIAKPGTFIPRDSTEFLAEQAIRRLRKRKAPVAVDLACGGGPVALSIKEEVPKAKVWGTDLQASAVRDARTNARNLRLKVDFVRGDLFGALPSKIRGKVDVITVHPPYVAKGELRELPDEIRKFEPVEVLTDGSKDGMGLVERTVAEAPEWLRDGGWLLIEVSPDRARKVMSVMRKGGFRDVRSTVDEGFKVTRVLCGKR